MSSLGCVSPCWRDATTTRHMKISMKICEEKLSLVKTIKNDYFHVFIWTIWSQRFFVFLRCWLWTVRRWPTDELQPSNTHTFSAQEVKMKELSPEKLKYKEQKEDFGLNLVQRWTEGTESQRFPAFDDRLAGTTGSWDAAVHGFGFQPCTTMLCFHGRLTFLGVLIASLCPLQQIQCVQLWMCRAQREICFTFPISISLQAMIITWNTESDDSQSLTTNKRFFICYKTTSLTKKRQKTPN